MTNGIRERSREVIPYEEFKEVFLKSRKAGELRRHYGEQVAMRRAAEEIAQEYILDSTRNNYDLKDPEVLGGLMAEIQEGNYSIGKNNFAENPRAYLKEISSKTLEDFVKELEPVEIGEESEKYRAHKNYHALFEGYRRLSEGDNSGLAEAVKIEEAEMVAEIDSELEGKRMYQLLDDEHKKKWRDGIIATARARLKMITENSPETVYARAIKRAEKKFNSLFPEEGRTEAIANYVRGVLYARSRISEEEMDKTYQLVGQLANYEPKKK